MKGYVTAKQKILIDHIPGTLMVKIKIDGRMLNNHETEELIRNDGFDSVDDFDRWFQEDFYGDLIHWTDKRY